MNELTKSNKSNRAGIILWPCFFNAEIWVLKYLRHEHGSEKENVNLKFFDVQGNFCEIRAVENKFFLEGEPIYW